MKSSTRDQSMILGMGLDIVENERIARSWERFGNRFAERILTTKEIQANTGKGFSPSYLASRFAAKEAAVKALGTGFAQGITFRHMQIDSAPSGKPEIAFLGVAEHTFRQIGGQIAHLSLSHGRDNSVAVVILEG